jgi:adenosylcobinamide-GDP ribazoletransferase
MRDSRVGSYGVLAGGLQLLLKYAVLVSLPVVWRGPALVLSLLCGRWAMAAAMWAFPYARAEGLGSGFKAGVTATIAIAATVLAAALAWAMLGVSGEAVLLIVAAVAWGLAAALARAVGGLTGDCYGAMNEVAEATVLVTLSGVSWSIAATAR